MPVAFDTSGMEQYDERTWFCPRTGDQVSLTYIDLVPDLPAPLDDLPLLRHRLALETAEIGALIEAHVVMIDSVPALYQLLKLPIPDRDSGQAFIAAFTVPKATCSVVLRVQCAEGEMTGLRESAVIAKVGPEAFVRPHPYAPALEGRLPWHVGDEERWDGRFPDHPLSRARVWANRTVNTARIDPAFAQLPPFTPGGPGPNDHTDFHAPVERLALPPASSSSSKPSSSSKKSKDTGRRRRSDSKPLDVPSLEAPALQESTSQLSAQPATAAKPAEPQRRASRHAKAEDAEPAARRSKLDSKSAWQLPPTDGEPAAETIGARASRTRRAAEDEANARSSTHRMTPSDELAAQAPGAADASSRIVSPNNTPPPYPLNSSGGAFPEVTPGTGRVVPNPASARSGTYPAVEPGNGAYPQPGAAQPGARPGAYPDGSPGAQPGNFPQTSPGATGARPGAFPEVAPATNRRQPGTANGQPAAFPGSPGAATARPGNYPDGSQNPATARPGSYADGPAATTNARPGAFPNGSPNGHPGAYADGSPGAANARPGSYTDGTPSATNARPGAFPDGSAGAANARPGGYTDASPGTANPRPGAFPDGANARPGGFPDSPPSGANGRPGAYLDGSPGTAGARPGAFPEVSPGTTGVPPGNFHQALPGAPDARPGAFPEASPGARQGAYPEVPPGAAGARPGSFPQVAPASSRIQPNGTVARSPEGGLPDSPPHGAIPAAPNNGRPGGYPDPSNDTTAARPDGFPGLNGRPDPASTPSDVFPGASPDPTSTRSGVFPSASPDPASNRSGVFPGVSPDAVSTRSGVFPGVSPDAVTARPGALPELPPAANGQPGRFPEISPSALNSYPAGQAPRFPSAAPNGYPSAIPDSASTRSGVFPAAAPPVGQPGARPGGLPALPPGTGATVANGSPVASGTFQAVQPGTGAPANGAGGFREIAPEFPAARAFPDNSLDSTNAHPPSAVGRPVAQPGAYPSGTADPIGSPQAMGIQPPRPLSPPMPRTGEPPVGPGEVMHTVLIGLPIGGYVPLWHENAVSYWRMTDPAGVRARLGIGIESRTEIDNRRFREAALFTPERNTLFLTDRFRNGQGNLGGASTQLIPATEDEAYRAATDKAMSEFYSWLGDVVVAAGQRGEYVAIETGGWHVPVTPVVLIMLRTDGREWHSVVETSPVPHGAPVWRDQQPVDGDTQLLASPATDRTMRAAGLLTRFAVATWPMHPFQLGLSFGPNPTLGDGPTR